MSPKERRAFASGYRFALWKARKELQEMSQRLDDELCRIDGEQRTAREQVAQRINNELDGVRAEMLGMRNDYRRLKAIEKALDVERDFEAPLN